MAQTYAQRQARGHEGVSIWAHDAARHRSTLSLRARKHTTKAVRYDARMPRRQGRELLDAAARIVQDATEVNWSREPATEYEAAIRTEYLNTAVLTFSGRSEIMHLAFTHESMAATDLVAASEKALEIISARVKAAELASLAEARRAVDARKPRTRRTNSGQ